MCANWISISSNLFKSVDNPTDEEREDFFEEMSIMKKLGSNPNVLGIFGCCTKATPRCIVMEYMENGDLLHFLREKRKKVSEGDFSQLSLLTAVIVFSLLTP